MRVIPYIHRDERPPIDVLVEALDGEIMTPGQLNYAITRLCLRFAQPAGYDAYNQTIGVLECAKLELYRMQVAPYEDLAILENGNVRP